MKYTDHLKFAKTLRSKQTEAEAKLWTNLRAKRFNGAKFKRQQPIGEYIVDFVNFENQLIIEVDGGQHNDRIRFDQDQQRTKWLESQGYKVLRFWNNDVFENLDGVLQVILDFIKKESPSL
jgi:very-short-patch-repair endonuclease